MMHRPILIVDDEPANLALLKQILSPAYPLAFARSGGDALAAVAKHRPALILLDVQMPDMDGYAVATHLKQNPTTADIPIIFVTGMAEVGDETHGFEVGAVDYIVKPVSPPVVQARVRTHLSLVKASQLEKSYLEAIYMLGEASRFKDTDTGTHIWRMADYCHVLALAAGWSEDNADLMRRAAPMHDLGKLAIPDAILHKPGKLDEAEWTVMKTHAMVGYHILERSDAPILRMAALIARHHHEKWDGTGYPDGLAGEAIPEAARIVAIADVFDALATARPYKEAWSFDRIMAHMNEGAGQHFDPRFIECFNASLPEIIEVRNAWEMTTQHRPHLAP